MPANDGSYELFNIFGGPMHNHDHKNYVTTLSLSLARLECFCSSGLETINKFDARRVWSGNWKWAWISANGTSKQQPMYMLQSLEENTKIDFILFYSKTFKLSSNIFLSLLSIYIADLFLGSRMTIQIFFYSGKKWKSVC